MFRGREIKVQNLDQKSGRGEESQFDAQDLKISPPLLPLVPPTISTKPKGRSLHSLLLDPSFYFLFLIFRDRSWTHLADQKGHAPEIPTAYINQFSYPDPHQS